jgi:hypothetical protein
MSRVNVHGTISNTLGYTGIVTLSQYIGGKKVKIAEKHNTGGKPLFEFLADCLVGDFDIAKLDLPNKILLLNKDDDGSIAKANNTDFIYLTSKPGKVENATEGIVKYSFIILQEIFSGTNFNAIGLYTNSATTEDVENFAAFCDIDTRALNDISMSSVLVLDWELHLSN